MRGQLGLPTFRRLNAAAVLAAALQLVVLAQGASVRTPQLTGRPGRTFRHELTPLPVGGQSSRLHPIPPPPAPPAFVAATCGPSLAVAARVYSLQRGGRAPLPSAHDTLAGLLALAAPRNAPAAAYALVAAGLAGGAAGLLGAGVGSEALLVRRRGRPEKGAARTLQAPQRSAGPATAALVTAPASLKQGGAPLDAPGVFLSRAAGAAAALAALVAYSLKDGADRGRLRAAPFRRGVGVMGWWGGVGVGAGSPAVSACPPRCLRWTLLDGPLPPRSQVAEPGAGREPAPGRGQRRRRGARRGRGAVAGAAGGCGGGAGAVGLRVWRRGARGRP
jgi:hypothetical protein